ncbi:Txe/YoeB family addiction module toxin [Nocardia asteroides]|uniref:Txe/YoeB family addiction module toxin n=1 Tax=Nocardia asteroides TaxID=1824 RepID=UPI001E6495C6|nr:Txe/YoeB family addiction module toxin [Nocardia asteroides]UGT63415.1 Txe/YoeB family addiction module toxin [Nocardia asteroides]
MKLLFTDVAWEDYQWWLANDKRVIKRVNLLLEDVKRNGHNGIGKPEALKHSLAGYWSRRITGEHRLVYAIENEIITVISCRYHYN